MSRYTAWRQSAGHTVQVSEWRSVWCGMVQLHVRTQAFHKTYIPLLHVNHDCVDSEQLIRRLCCGFGMGIDS